MNYIFRIVERADGKFTAEKGYYFHTESSPVWQPINFVPAATYQEATTVIENYKVEMKNAKPKKITRIK